MKRKPSVNDSFPTLNRLMAAGHVVLETNESGVGSYLGIAADGVKVWLGNDWEPQHVEEYLRHCPDPIYW